MGNPIIQLTSVTYAIRAQKVLERHGIRTTMRKKANPMESRGCGYGVEVYGDVRYAADILRNAGIKVVEIVG